MATTSDAILATYRTNACSSDLASHPAHFLCSTTALLTAAAAALLREANQSSSLLKTDVLRPNTPALSTFPTFSKADTSSHLLLHDCWSSLRTSALVHGQASVHAVSWPSESHRLGPPSRRFFLPFS